MTCKLSHPVHVLEGSKPCHSLQNTTVLRAIGFLPSRGTEKSCHMEEEVGIDFNREVRESRISLREDICTGFSGRREQKPKAWKWQDRVLIVPVRETGFRIRFCLWSTDIHIFHFWYSTSVKILHGFAPFTCWNLLESLSEYQRLNSCELLSNFLAYNMLTRLSSYVVDNAEDSSHPQNKCWADLEALLILCGH